MSQDQIQKLDAVLSSEQARELLRETSNDKLFSDSDKLVDVLNHVREVNPVMEKQKLPTALEDTLGVSLKDLEHMVLDPSSATDLFQNASVENVHSEILEMETQCNNTFLIVWLDHSYSLHPKQFPGELISTVSKTDQKPPLQVPLVQKDVSVSKIVQRPALQVPLVNKAALANTINQKLTLRTPIVNIILPDKSVDQTGTLRVPLVKNVVSLNKTDQNPALQVPLAKTDVSANKTDQVTALQVPLVKKDVPANETDLKPILQVPHVKKDVPAVTVPDKHLSSQEHIKEKDDHMRNEKFLEKAEPKEDDTSETDAQSPEKGESKAGPRRRSQRQIEKLTREQVEKIKAENADMERKEREKTDSKVESELPVSSFDEEGISNSDYIENEDPDITDSPPELKNTSVKTKNLTVEKQKKVKIEGTIVERTGIKTRNRSVSESSVEGRKEKLSPSPKLNKTSKGAKAKRKRNDSNSLSPSKKCDDEGDLSKAVDEKCPTAEKKKKKIKKEKPYEEGLEPALFSLPDKMIKGKNDVLPEIKLVRTDSVPESSGKIEGKKTEIKLVRTDSISDVLIKGEQRKPEIILVRTDAPNLNAPKIDATKPVLVAASVKQTTPIKPEAKVVIIKENPMKDKNVKPPISTKVSSSSELSSSEVDKAGLISIKKENEIPQKAVKQSVSVDNKTLKPAQNANKGKSIVKEEGFHVAANNVSKIKTDKTIVTSKASISEKHKALSNNVSSNTTSKQAPNAVKVKTKSKDNASKTAETRPVSVTKVHSAEKEKPELKNKKIKNTDTKVKQKQNISKDKAGPTLNAEEQKIREKRSVKKKSLDPNEIHPDEASDHEEYSDDANDSDWGSEDDPEKLWCICNQPANDRFMIQCDPCSNWFHGTCVGVTRQQGRQMEKGGVEWTCPQCRKTAAQTIAAASETKSKPVKKETDSKSTISMKSPAIISTSLQCIVCKSSSRKGSVYCGDNCIEQHVREVLKQFSPQTSKSESNQVEQKNVEANIKRVVVMERGTGKLYTGPNAPTQDALLVWLKANPTFEALKPGGPSSNDTNSISSANPAKKTKVDDKDDRPERPRNDPEPVRINVRKTLKDILFSRCKDAEDVTVSDEAVMSITMKIEEELFKLFKDTNSKYKAKYRSLMFNVKDPRNQGLFRKIVNRKIPPHQLVRMSPDELASKELAKWRERENQHALEMIKKEQLENSQMPSAIIKKTHKGEVEIDDGNLAIMEPQKEAHQDVKSEDMSDIKAMLADTTNEHRTHLFDLNCQICTGRKAISELQTENSPEKRKIKVARTISLEKPLDTSSKDNASVLVPKVVEPLPENKEVKEKSVKELSDKKMKKTKKKVALLDEPSDHEPSSTVSFGSPDAELRMKSVSLKMPIGKPSVWKGFIFMLDVTKFVTSAHKVSGPTSSLSQEIPDTVQVCGRIPPDEVWTYLSKIKQGGNKELIVMRFQPANEEERGPYEAFYNYLNSRKRYGVVRNSNKMIKDFYIIPLGSHNPVPTVLMPFDGPGLDSSRPNLLLGVLVRHKHHKAKTSTSAASDNTQTQVSDKLEHLERSYTPPLDAMPCQSTTVDSSNSTSNAHLASNTLIPITLHTLKPKSPTPPPVVNISSLSPKCRTGPLSPSTLIPSSLLATILAPKIADPSKISSRSYSEEPKSKGKRLPSVDDEPYEPSYTPPLEKVSKLNEEDRPYDPDDLDNLDVQPKVNVRSFLEAPSSNSHLEAQQKLLAELTRQVEEQKEQIERQKTQVFVASNSNVAEKQTDILLPEMLQSILKNIQATSGQTVDNIESREPTRPQTDTSVGNAISTSSKSTSLSSMSAKELVERAQRELDDLQKNEFEGEKKNLPFQNALHQNPIPTHVDAASVGYPPQLNSHHSKLEPPPPGVDMEEHRMENDYPPFYPDSNNPHRSNPYPALAPPFQHPSYYSPSQGPIDPYHQGPSNEEQQHHHHHQQQQQEHQQWGHHNREPGQGAWPVAPPSDPFFQGQGEQWGERWAQQPAAGWERPAWNQPPRDSDDRDRDYRIQQRRDDDRFYDWDRNRK